MLGSMTDSDEAWRAWYEGRRAAVDAAISAHLNCLKDTPGDAGALLEAIAYSWRLGGKRTRPVLVLECCRLCGGDEAAAWPAALAVEAIHTFSLIHDDLPAMDDDDLRRGQPTSHKVFGEARAILAGDWLVAHAFELLTNCGGPARVRAMVQCLASGTQAMALGQAADIAGQERLPEPDLVRQIHLNKTARLIETSCRLGALAADAGSEHIAALSEFGLRLGLAFQIQDDLLDRTSSTAALGKRAGKDESAAKQTYPAAFGLEASRRQAAAEVAAARAALVEFGPDGQRLVQLADFVIARQA
jgi:geranylgeranyl diphosphate synthase type II